MAVPRFDQLHQLHDPIADRPYRGRLEPYELGLPLSRGEAKCDRPIRVTHQMGAPTPSEIIWTTGAAPLILHARVLEVLENEGFTGWTGYPVEVFSKAGERVPDYAGLTITGRCGRIDLAQSEIVLRQFPGGWIPHFLGHYFPPDSWDQSDLFMEAPDRLGKVTVSRFVTERVRRALEKAEIKSIRFTRLTEKATSTSIYTIGLQHLLPPDFEARVAAAFKTAGVPRPDFV